MASTLNDMFLGDNTINWSSLPDPNTPWDQDGGGGTAAPWLNLDFLRSLGYSGKFSNSGTTGEGDPGDGGAGFRDLQDWMSTAGYSYKTNPTVNGGHIQALFDKNNQEVAGSRWEKAAPNDNTFWRAALAAGALVGGAAGGAFGNPDVVSSTALPGATTAQTFPVYAGGTGWVETPLSALGGGAASIASVSPGTGATTYPVSSGGTGWTTGTLSPVVDPVGGYITGTGGAEGSLANNFW